MPLQSRVDLIILMQVENTFMHTPSPSEREVLPTCVPNVLETGAFCGSLLSGCMPMEVGGSDQETTTRRQNACARWETKITLSQRRRCRYLPQLIHVELTKGSR